MSKLKLVSVGDAAKDVVVKLAPRVGGKPVATLAVADKPNSPLMSQLRGTLARLGSCAMSDESDWQEYRRLQVIKGKNKITEGLDLIRQGASADAATEHLIDVLKAIGGKATVGSEEF